MLFHTFANTWIEVFPAPTVDQPVAQWSFNGVLVICALIVVAVFGPARLSRKPASEFAAVAHRG
jgi:hypothetical protein